MYFFTIATFVGLFSPWLNKISNKITDIWESLSQCLFPIATFAGLFSSVGLYISKDTIPTKMRLISTVCKYMTFQARIPPNQTCHNFYIDLVFLQYGNSCDFSNHNAVKNTCHKGYINISFLQFVQINEYLLIEYYLRTTYHSQCISNYSLQCVILHELSSDFSQKYSFHNAYIYIDFLHCMS